MTYVTKTWRDTGNEQPPDTRIAAAILVALRVEPNLTWAFCGSQAKNLKNINQLPPIKYSYVGMDLI